MLISASLKNCISTILLILTWHITGYDLKIYSYNTRDITLTVECVLQAIIMLWLNIQTKSTCNSRFTFQIYTKFIYNWVYLHWYFLITGVIKPKISERCYYKRKLNIWGKGGLWCVTPLSTIFQLYRGSHF